jgi:hypothetical protein
MRSTLVVALMLSALLSAGCGHDNPNQMSPALLQGDWLRDSLQPFLSVNQIPLFPLYDYASFDGDSVSITPYQPYMHFMLSEDTLTVVSREYRRQVSDNIDHSPQDTAIFRVVKLTRDSLWLSDWWEHSGIIRLHNARLHYDSTLHLQRVNLSTRSGMSAMPFHYEIQVSRDRYCSGSPRFSDSSNRWVWRTLVSDSAETFFDQVEEKFRTSVLDSAHKTFAIDAPSYSMVVYSNRGREVLSGTSSVNMLVAFLVNSHPLRLRSSDMPCTSEMPWDTASSPPKNIPVPTPDSSH